MKQTILSHLPGDHPWQSHIFCYDTIPSTNDLAKTMAKNGAAHGSVIIAKSQTAGRGRMGRSFHAPMGLGIYFSLILRPNCRPEELMHLTCATAVAMCNAIERCSGYRPGVKWINDLIGNKKKIGGILTELSINSKTGLVDWAVIGIGINCLHTREDFPPELHKIATSLLEVTGKQICPEHLAAYMILALYDMQEKLLTQRCAIMTQYRKDCVTLHQDVLLICGEETQTGKALDVDEDGGLVVEFPDGTVKTVQSGEASVRNFCGYV